MTTTRERVTRWVHWRLRPGQKSENVYRGVYRDFAEARAAIGDDPGYDSSTGGTLYRDRLGQVFPEDYAVAFWLKPLVGDIKRIFDFGGHVGLHFYGLGRLLELPPQVEWWVSDVPAVIREGESLARSRGATGLKFTRAFDGLDGSDVLLSSGALQYLEAAALPAVLRSCKQPPRHLLLNKLPVRDGDGFVTVQDTWMFKSPYTVFGHRALVGALEGLGYKLRDEWKNPRHHCLLLGDRARSVDEFSGFYFVRA